MSGSKTRSARAPRLLAAALASTICAPAIAMLATAPAAHALTGDRAPAGDHSFTAQLHIGGKDPQRGCSGAVVSKQWLLTATSCFASTPGVDVQAGKPALKSTATVGKQSIDIIEVVPRDDRDVAMVRLARPVADITPVPVAGDAPAAGETLTGAGFGRTKTTWVPDALHTGSFRVDSTDGTTAALTGLDGASVCKGDAGGPLLRVKGGKAELVSLHSRSWQGGCLGSQATRTEAVDARVDDLAGWVKDVSHRDKIHPADIDGDGKADLLVHRTNGDVVYHRNLGSRFAAGTVMSSGWGRFVDGKDLGRLYFSDVTGDGKADLVVHGRDGKVVVRKNMGAHFDGGTEWTSGWGRFVDGKDLGRLYFSDVTGDGKADLVVHGRDGKVVVRKNMGAHFDGGTEWTSGWGRFVDGKDLGRLYFSDVTGDGKADLVEHRRDGKVVVRKNMGTHFDGGTDWSSGWGRFVDGTDMGVLRFADANGDKKADLFAYVINDGTVSVRKNMGSYFDGGTVMLTL